MEGSRLMSGLGLLDVDISPLTCEAVRFVSIGRFNREIS